MRIMVFDVAASTGGAVSILEDFVQQINDSKDDTNEWIFILSKVKIRNSLRIKSYNFEWIKKSWLHRLYFEIFFANKIIKENQIDHVFSLQNLILPFTNCKQTIYLHNALPFERSVANPITEFKLWLYINLVKPFVVLSIRRADHIIVQTNWFKDTITQQLNINEHRISVISPRISIQSVENVTSNHDVNHFFYPTAPYNYKNNQLIIDAVRKLKEHTQIQFEVTLTLDKKENQLCKQLYRIVNDEDLPIKFIGRIERLKVYEEYKKSILLFPSKIETYGLPLMEARMMKALILAINLPYAHEILDGYPNVYFFNKTGEDLPNLMMSVLNKSLDYTFNEEYNLKEGMSLVDFFNH